MSGIKAGLPPTVGQAVFALRGLGGRSTARAPPSAPPPTKSLAQLWIDFLRPYFDGAGTLSGRIPYTATLPSNEVIIPSEIAGVTVIALGNTGYNGLFRDLPITSVSIPDTIGLLGYSVFQACPALEAITIPSSVTSLGNSCFRGSALEAITIPSSVTSLGSSCFRECPLETVIIFGGATPLVLNPYCFLNCDNLVTITIPGRTTSLPSRCLAYCSNLETVRIENGPTSLGDACFHYCGKLATVTLPSSVTSLYDECFRSCIGLTRIIIPSSVELMGNPALTPHGEKGGLCFYDCTVLTAVHFLSSTPPTTLGTKTFALESTGLPPPALILYVGTTAADATTFYNALVALSGGPATFGFPIESAKYVDGSLFPPP